MLRQALLSVSRNDSIRDVVSSTPISRDVVARFIAGDSMRDAVRVTGEIAGDGRLITIDRLGEDTLDLAAAQATRDAYLALLTALDEKGLTHAAEVSVKLSAVGQALAGDGEKIAYEHAAQICERATEVGTTVTLDMEDHTTTDSTLGILRQLRADFPATGAVLQAYLHRTEADCRDLATAGSRVRLCKGAYAEPESVAFADPHEVDKSYVRCAKILLNGQGYPMLATHDPRLIAIGAALAGSAGREKKTYEFQMLFGVRPEEQSRLAAEGHRMRVYLPYGADWWGYMVRRMAEKPANLALFLRSLTSKS